MKFKSSIVFFILATIFSFTFFSCKNTQKELKVYSIIHDEETKILCEEFTKKTGIPVSYLRATTGEIINKVIAEKNNPQADVLLGDPSITPPIPGPCDSPKLVKRNMFPNELNIVA